jgi:hypothetical protein
VYFPPFMALFFPDVDAWIDWSQSHEFLDAELQKLTGDSLVFWITTRQICNPLQ